MFSHDWNNLCIFIFWRSGAALTERCMMGKLHRDHLPRWRSLTVRVNYECSQRYVGGVCVCVFWAPLKRAHCLCVCVLGLFGPRSPPFSSIALSQGPWWFLDPYRATFKREVVGFEVFATWQVSLFFLCFVSARPSLSSPPASPANYR